MTECLKNYESLKWLDVNLYWKASTAGLDFLLEFFLITAFAFHCTGALDPRYTALSVSEYVI